MCVKSSKTYYKISYYDYTIVTRFLRLYGQLSYVALQHSLLSARILAPMSNIAVPLDTVALDYSVVYFAA